MKYELYPTCCGDICSCYHVKLLEYDEINHHQRMVWDSIWVSEPYNDEEEKRRLVEDVLEKLDEYGLTLNTTDFNDYYHWKCVEKNKNVTYDTSLMVSRISAHIQKLRENLVDDVKKYPYSLSILGPVNKQYNLTIYYPEVEREFIYQLTEDDKFKLISISESDRTC